MIKVNLNEADDELNSHWWVRIRSSDFAFQSRIPNQEQAEGENEDIFIHKEILEGDRYPTIRYHTILDEELLPIDGKDAREILAKKMAEFIKKNNRLPFKTEFKSVSKGNHKINLKYSPNPNENFKLVLFPEWVLDGKNTEQLNQISVDEIAEKFRSLPTDSTNPLAMSGDPTYTIKPVPSAPIIEQIATESGKESVYIENGEIKTIDLRKSYYMGNETVYYLIRVKGGKAATDKKKDSLRRKFDKINVKCSENAMKKYKLEVGDVVNFTGKLKNDKKLKLIIQNVRKFEKIM